MFAPAQVIDLDQSRRTMQVRKRIWDAEHNQFREVCFVRVFIHSRQDLSDAMDNLKLAQGEPSYQGSWWHDDRSIWLHERLAVWWLLQHDL